MILLNRIIAANELYTGGLHPTEAYLGVDFDRTLSSTEGLGDSKMNPGPPIESILDLVKKVLALGIKVKIFTARVDFAPESLPAVKAWCVQHLGQELEITNVKTAGMFYLLDDKAFNVTPNGEIHDPNFNGLKKDELERLANLSEDCAEIIHIVSKIIRHGFESKHPDGGPTNRQLLEQEIGDFFATLTMMSDNKDVNDDNIEIAMEQKFNKINKYLHYNEV